MRFAIDLRDLHLTAVHKPDPEHLAHSSKAPGPLMETVASPLIPFIVHLVPSSLLTTKLAQSLPPAGMDVIRKVWSPPAELSYGTVTLIPSAL